MDNEKLINSMEEFGKAIDSGAELEWFYEGSGKWGDYTELDQNIPMIVNGIKDGKIRIKPEPRVAWVNVYVRGDGGLSFVDLDSEDAAISAAEIDRSYGGAKVVAHPIPLPEPS